MVKSMRHMDLNERAVIKTVAANKELGRRIRDMGLLPGTEVLIVGRAPLLDPVALRLKGFTMALRNSEADHITVETEG
ncbi:FeoA family protein [Desulfobacca acetoxidans]|uniref:FeoA family protein n=1 Tax=Desulfobacca acetoxidans (strain ATCC 700848 / DSM 11109 / ASRB2) TaxID=880072 RepID=F2NC57_DESAR|nr:FeoA family protein [Desulfobacca acetoxidans]AEB08852.1 FeoA family protein [Desulfobacca acetoxidans DSM 11109]HAY20701.1 ferrous iron transport protein A [Desulfobacterales bacterium]